MSTAPVSRGEFVMMASPFADLDAEEVEKVRESMRDAARRSFDAAIDDLETVVANTPSLGLLGDLAFQFWMHQDGIAGGGEYALEQHHVEHAQAMILRGPLNPSEPDAYVAPAVQAAIEALRRLGGASAIRRWPDGDLDQVGMARFEVTESIRRFHQDVRGDFNPEQFERFMRVMLARIDERFEAVHGTRATVLLDVLLVLLRNVERRLLDFQRRLSFLRRSRRGGKAVSTYLRFFAGTAVGRSELLANAASRKVPSDRMGAYLFAQAFAELPQALSFDVAEIAAALPPDASENAALRAFGRWTIAFGELSAVASERLLLDNPVRVRPFVPHDRGRWMWPSPGILFSGGIDMFELLVDDDEALRKAYSEARAKFLEAETARLLSDALPSAEVWTGVRWTDPESAVPYETDVVVRIDDVLLVVEAKSGQLSDAARRGADARLTREIHKLMEDPARQSARFVDHVRSPSFVDGLGCDQGRCVLRMDRVRRVVRLTVAFETPGPLATAWPKLVGAGIIAPDVDHAPVMGLSDLEVALHLMGDEATIVHYLLRRTAFERTADFMAEEHDLAAFYLRGGFALAEVESGDVWLNAYGMSDMLRDYYSRSPDGVRAERPAPLRAPLWRDWIGELCLRRPERWTTMAAMLLDVSHPAQEAVSEQFREATRAVVRSRGRSAFRATTVPTGPEERRGAVVPVVYRDMGTDEVRALATDLRDAAGAETAAERVLVVGVDVANPRPYAFMAIGDPR